MPRLLFIGPVNIRKGLANTETGTWPPLNPPYLAALPTQYDLIEIVGENVEVF
jgi:hypothetical protein